MPSEKRQRQDEARYSRRVAEATAAKRRQRNRQIATLGIIVALIAVAALLISVLSGDDGDDPVEAGADTSTSTSVAEDGEPIEVTYPGPGAAVTGETPCPPADGSAERTTSFEQAPPTCIEEGRAYQAIVETTEGAMVFDLDAEAAPVAVNNFVVLARYRYFDGVPFHRIVPGFVNQAGTPVDQASPDIETNPGYTIPDELPDTSGLASPADAYPEGTLAMANRGPDTGSSQWFIVIGDGGQSFASNPNYTIFGRVAEGIEVARRINQFGDGATNGTPTKAVTITSVTITES